MDNKLKSNNEAWILRLRFTQQMLFASVKKIGQNSGDAALSAIVSKAWFSGYDESSKRLLPDGKLAKGGAFPNDLILRNEIIAEVIDGLKQRPRGKDKEVRSLFKIQMFEYDLLMAMSQTYQVAEKFIHSDDINPYEASSLETAANTMMYVARTDETEQVLYTSFEEGEDQVCPL